MSTYQHGEPIGSTPITVREQRIHAAATCWSVDQLGEKKRKTWKECVVRESGDGSDESTYTRGHQRNGRLSNPCTTGVYMRGYIQDAA